MTLPAGYFDDMYAGSPDPWGFRSRWYEQRKRAVTLAALPDRRYHRAFEPGCSIGELTQGLAERCDRLLATDVSGVALKTAAARLADCPHVEVAQLAVPEQWPDGEWDLVVLSELGYYLDGAGRAELVRRSVGALVAGGTLLACHWRHEVSDYPATGDEVHATLAASSELAPAVHHLEEDFVVEVWTRGRVPSPARAEGLV